MVLCGRIACELQEGSATVGRLAGCDIELDDPLVSRRHALIRVGPDGVQIEDLHSANGVYVNGERIVHAVTLHPGDSALVGTQEVSFFEGRLEKPVESGWIRREQGAEAVPAAKWPKLRLVSSEDPGTAVGTDLPVAARANALNVVGLLVRRLAEEGKLDEAVRIMTPHLRGLLRGANSGLAVPAELCSSAARHAIDVAHWSADSTWLDYVLELHVAAHQIMERSVILALQHLPPWLGDIDHALLEYYANTLAQRFDGLSRDEQTRMAMIRSLIPR